jgi:3D (Asp-Asp-Asp) domain-containing protein
MKLISILGFFLLAITAVDAHASYTDSDGLEWEEPVEEIIESETAPFELVDGRRDSDFDRDLPAEDGDDSSASLTKKRVDQYLTPTCDKIVGLKEKFTKERISLTTQYFVPLFYAGTNGGLQNRHRRACIEIEGSCVVEKYLYNWAGYDSPWGKRYERKRVPFKFGKGSGQSYYNSTNALDPCRTVAADPAYYPAGTVIYVPELRGKLCPQNQRPVDGCFIVGDVGGAIRGQGRFDLFTGECLNYDLGRSICRDRGMSSFTVRRGAEFFVIKRHNMLAKGLREDADLLINNNWIYSIFPKKE